MKSLFEEMGGTYTLGADGMSGESFIADTQINVEEETVHNIMLEKLRGALDKFSAEELLLIDLLYSQTKSERETASILGISQNVKLFSSS